MLEGEEGVKNMCRIVEDYGKEREDKGRKETAIANAKNMLSDNVSPEQVAKWTLLPLEQVFALKEELEREAACVAK